jgi:hypothetical protein
MKTKPLGVALTIAFLGASSPVYAQTSGFLYSGGTYTILTVPGSSNTEAFGINDAGRDE